MTSTLAGADIRGFYTALGIELPSGAGPNLLVHCFADPEAHAHGDRNASCSVNIENGAWKCWGCGAKGGAFDAATRRGRNTHDAMELLFAYRIAERRGRRPLKPVRSRRESVTAAPAAPASRRPTHQLQADDDDIQRWSAALRERPWPLDSMREEQRHLWRAEVLADLEVGWDRGRLTFPIRSCRGELKGVLRYSCRPTRGPKMLAVKGSRLGLLPNPELTPNDWHLLCEGPADMISARSRGLPAIAVPGDHAWQPGWADMLEGARVAVVMDCDSAGRGARERILQDLADADVIAAGVELAAHRDDTFDLTDWLDAHRHLSNSAIRALFIP